MAAERQTDTMVKAMGNDGKEDERNLGVVIRKQGNKQKGRMEKNL